MASFVEFGTEQELAIELAKFINKTRTAGKESTASNYVQECEKLAANNDNLVLLIKLLEDFHLLLVEADRLTEKETEGCFFVILSILTKLGSEHFHNVLPKLLLLLTTANHSGDEKPMLRLRLLNHLYNLADKTVGSTGADRYTIFMTILKYASEKHIGDAIFGQLHERDIEERIEEWHLNAQQKSDLYKTIRNIFKGENKSMFAYKWTVKYLSSFEGSLDENEVLEESMLATVEAIKLPDLFQFDDLLGTCIAKKLEKDTKGKALLQLLRIFVEENLESFKAFDADLLKSFGLKEEECARKMRLLSLTTLAAAHQEISYAQISKTLHIPENDVETWVVLAISENLISAKMDQLRRTVTVSQTLQRVFARPQWKQLSDSLATWRNNIKVLSDTLHQTKPLLV